MPLDRPTAGQRRLVKEIEEIATSIEMDHRNISEHDKVPRTARLYLIKLKLINAEIVFRYTLIDEYLSDVICNFYFSKRKSEVTYRRLWKTEKFKIFNHYVLDEIYILQKMRIVDAIKPIPREHKGFIAEINDLRNAITHSFFPQNRRRYLKSEAVMYRGDDVYTKEGIEKLVRDARKVQEFLQARAGR
jgi:hypothetical protein